MTGGAGSQSEMLTYNVDNGFPEAILRSLRKGLLTGVDFDNMKLSSNATEFRLVLEDTDYGITDSEYGIFEGQAENKLEPVPLGRAMRKKICNEIKYIMGQSVYPLTEFLNYILDEHKIDTIVYMMDGIKNGRSTEELLKTCEPMGMFSIAELKALATQDDDFVALY
jgi:V-type H+-transporting ATPase subunit d